MHAQFTRVPLAIRLFFAHPCCIWLAFLCCSAGGFFIRQIYNEDRVLKSTEGTGFEIMPFFACTIHQITSCKQAFFLPIPAASDWRSFVAVQGAFYIRQMIYNEDGGLKSTEGTGFKMMLFSHPCCIRLAFLCCHARGFL